MVNIARSSSAKTPEKRAAARHPLMSLREDFDRLFNSLFSEIPFGARLTAADPFRSAGLDIARAGDLVPEVDVAETDKGLIVSAELPGLSEQDIDISISDDILTVKGEKKSDYEEKEANYYLSERSYGTFSRSFRLPDSIDQDKIEAQFENGVLRLTLPKSEEAARQPRKISLKGSGSAEQSGQEGGGQE